MPFPFFAGTREKKMKKLITLLVITLFIGVLFAGPMDEIDDWAKKQTEDFDAEDVITFLNGNREGDITYGSEYVFNSAGTDYHSAAALDATHFVVAYRDVGNYNYGTAIIGTVSGTTISYGSEYVFNSAATAFTSAAALDATHFVVAYQDKGFYDYGTAVIGTVSGSTISYGSEYVFNSANAYFMSAAALDATHFVVAYMDGGNSEYGTAVIGTVSGSTISYGSEYVFNSAPSTYNSAAALDAAHFVVAYTDNVNSSYGTAVIGTVSSSTISYGSEYVFNSAATYSSAAALDAAHFVVAYADYGNSNYGTAVVGTKIDLPGAPSNPSPADLLTDVSVDADLSWTNGADTDTIDLYFDTNNPPTTKVIDNTLATTYDPGTMDNSETYYWKVVCKNGDGDTEGSVWSFTTIMSAPGAPSAPTPTDTATDVSIDADLGWTNGSGTATIDLYFDTNNPPTTKVIDNTLATTYYPGTMDNSETYYWKVVCKNAGGDTEGSVWSFTTEEPTAITLSSFTATYAADELAICWSTQSESNNAGWNIYRADNECIEEAMQVNGSLIEGAGTTSEPTDYTFYDLIPVQAGTTYNYWLESRDYTGSTETYGPVSLTVPQPGDDPNDPDNAEFFGLYQNIPNPLENNTTIRYNLKEAANCKLVIYNTKGQTVKTFTANNTDSGEFVWDRKDTKGNEVASGLYFYRLDAGDDFFIKKMVVSQ